MSKEDEDEKKNPMIVMVDEQTGENTPWLQARKESERMGT